MATTVVNTQIVVQFDDQFSKDADQANENYLKSLKEVQKKTESFNVIFDAPFQKYFEDLQREFDKLNTLQKTGWIGTFTVGAVALAGFSQKLGILIATLSAFYLTWLTADNLKEWLVGGQPVDEYIDGVKQSLEQLGNLEGPALPPIPPDLVQSMESAKSCLEQLQKMQNITVQIDLDRNILEEAKRLRQEIEALFSEDITQRIKIIEERKQASFFSTGFPSSDNNSQADFLTDSPDLTGFNSSVDSTTSPRIPGFATGIDRVPRDMLAMIHKDEAVLPKNQAEDYRRGDSNGMNIQNLNFSFNVPNAFNLQELDREQFRTFAFKLMGEMKRLNNRIN